MHLFSCCLFQVTFRFQLFISPAMSSVSHRTPNIDYYQTNYPCSRGLRCDKIGAILFLRTPVLFRLCSFTSPARTLQAAQQGRMSSVEHAAKTPMRVWFPLTIEAASAAINASSNSRTTTTPNTDIPMPRRLIATEFTV